MEFDEILATCIERLEMGETVESCLALFPDEAEELAPLLQMAVDVRSMPAPVLSEAGFKKGRQAVTDAANLNKEYSLVSALPDAGVMLLDETGARVPGPRQNGGLERKTKQKRRFAWPTLVGTAVAAALIIAVLVGVSQAPQIVPGNALYTVKHVTEQGQGVLMSALGNEADWHAMLVDRRLRELQSLQASGEPTSAEQMDELLSEVELAVAASEDLSADEQVQLRSELNAELARAQATLTMSGPAMVELVQMQNALSPAAPENAVAAAPTVAPIPTAEPSAEQPVAEDTEDAANSPEPAQEPNSVVESPATEQPVDESADVLATQPDSDATPTEAAAIAVVVPADQGSNGEPPAGNTGSHTDMAETDTAEPDAADVAATDESTNTDAGPTETAADTADATTSAPSEGNATSSMPEASTANGSDTETNEQPSTAPEPTQQVFQPTPTWTPQSQPTTESQPQPTDEAPSQPALADVPDDHVGADATPSAMAAMAIESTDEAVESADAGSDATAEPTETDSAPAAVITDEPDAGAQANVETSMQPDSETNVETNAATDAEEPTATATNTVTPTATLQEDATVTPDAELTQTPESDSEEMILSPTPEPPQTPKPAKPPVLLPTATATPTPIKSAAPESEQPAIDEDVASTPVAAKQTTTPTVQSDTGIIKPTAAPANVLKPTVAADAEPSDTAEGGADAGAGEVPAEAQPAATQTPVKPTAEPVDTSLQEEGSDVPVIVDDVGDAEGGSDVSLPQPTAESDGRPLQRLLERQPSSPPLLLPTPTSTPGS